MVSLDVRQLAICKKKGMYLTPKSVILDFGCADGHRVYQLRGLGYAQTFGYNQGNYMNQDNPVRVCQEADREWFRFSDDGRMPYPDGLFDLIISDRVFEHVRDQETTLREIHRILKPGGVCINVLPAKWYLIDPHIKVPLGGFEPFKSYAWYYLWARLGVRNQYQRGKSAEEVAVQNLAYARESLHYLSCQQYRRLLERLQFKVSWEELAYLQTSHEPRIQQWAAAASAVPLLIILIRTFVERVMLLRKAY